MSNFVIHHTGPLFRAAFSAPRAAIQPSHSFQAPSPQIQKLQVLLEAFQPSSSVSDVHQVLFLLQNDRDGPAGGNFLDHEHKSLTRVATGAIVAWIYGQALSMCLQQATEADAEATWWSELESSRRRLLWYILETLPIRMKRAFDTIVDALRAKDLAVTPLAFTPNSLRKLFPSTLRPSRLAVSFFPHLSTHSRLLFHSPFELARQECQHHRQSLHEIRDNRAQRLGMLVSYRNPLRAALASETENLAPFIEKIQDAIGVVNVRTSDINGEDPIENLSDIVLLKLRQASRLHVVGISPLLKPSPLTRIWPRLVLFPPITLLLFRVAYGARGSLRENFSQAVQTVTGFWNGYLLQPLKEILGTVRTGGEEGTRIVSREGVRSDMESLERMVLSLSHEKYALSPPELEVLSAQIRRGDLTSVLKVYEEDLKSPLRSAIAGSLIRSLLIQVQKMKVDVDVALSGIDKLLRSQELTFAFVGVAPAIAIIYGIVKSIKNIWSNGRGRGKYGGKRRRRAVWLSMRRIERLLTLSAASSSSVSSSSSELTQGESLSALDHGLILLSVAQLRTYAETYLPPRSYMREEFLLDVSDLEDPKLGRKGKRDVVSRMWRSWGGVLQWSLLGAT